MSLFVKTKKLEKRRLIKTIKIQAIEGQHDEVMIESMLTGRRINLSVPGTTNAFANYDSQVTETYRKYNAQADFGNQETRAVVDLRTAFISGEGISISCDDENTSEWIEDFLSKNKLQGFGFIDAVKGSEMAGQSLCLLKEKEWKDGSLYIKIVRVPYTIKTPYRAIYNDPLTKENVIDIEIKKNDMWTSAGFSNFVYTRIGGDDGNTAGPVTKVGTVLTDLENYDRAIKDMRRNNHIFARITPVFQVETESEGTALRTMLNNLKWKIGHAFIGTAKFKYETPTQGAHDNLKTELISTIKTISSVTGIPVHWLGYVDLMSNRSTADSLYELIKNATIAERAIWTDSLYDMILMGQELYINAGGKDLNKLDYDFEVKLPLIDFNEFLNRVKGLSLAYTDRSISLGDYRNMLPGIDPLKTKRALENEDKEEEDKLVKMGQQFPENKNTEEGDSE